MIDTGIKPEEVDDIIASVNEKVLSSEEELAKFLKFSSSFTQFSLKNLLLLYAQVPAAKYIGAQGAIQYLSERNFEVENQDGPLIIRCPVVENGEARIDILPVFAFDVVPSGNYKIIDAADSISQLDDLTAAFKAVTGRTIYASKDTRFKKIQEQNGTLVLPTGSNDHKIHLLVEYYGSNISGKESSGPIKERAERIFTYLYYSRYPNAKYLPPLSACIYGNLEERERALENAVLQFKRITDRMRKPQMIVYPQGVPEIEKKQKAQEKEK